MSGLPIVVVKLGGSLVGDPALNHWLGALGGANCARFAVVPGGGPFADAVRAAQARCGFDDGIAHEMALLAMDQCGCLLSGLHESVRLCRTESEIGGAWADRRLAVWLPSRLLLSERSLERSWSVTSDTIAAWLAQRLHAAGLILVKSCAIGAARDDAAALAAAGIVDPALPAFVRHHAIPLDALDRSQWAGLEDAVGRLLRGARQLGWAAS